MASDLDRSFRGEVSARIHAKRSDARGAPRRNVDVRPRRIVRGDDGIRVRANGNPLDDAPRCEVEDRERIAEIFRDVERFVVGRQRDAGGISRQPARLSTRKRPSGDGSAAIGMFPTGIERAAGSRRTPVGSRCSETGCVPTTLGADADFGDPLPHARVETQAAAHAAPPKMRSTAPRRLRVDDLTCVSPLAERCSSKCASHHTPRTRAAALAWEHNEREKHPIAGGGGARVSFVHA